MVADASAFRVAHASLAEEGLASAFLPAKIRTEIYSSHTKINPYAIVTQLAQLLSQKFSLKTVAWTQDSEVNLLFESTYLIL